MFNLSLPTDNLYKFVAVFGLVILVTGYLMYERLTKDVRESFDNVLARVNDADRDSGELSAMLVRIPRFETLSVPEKQPSSDLLSDDYRQYLSTICECCDTGLSQKIESAKHRKNRES